MKRLVVALLLLLVGGCGSARANYVGVGLATTVIGAGVAAGSIAAAVSLQKGSYNDNSVGSAIAAIGGGLGGILFLGGAYVTVRYGIVGLH